MNRYIEHTILRPETTEDEVLKLIDEALEHNFVGVCVPPFWVKKAARELRGSSIQLVTVIGFPLGYNMTEVKLEEIKMAINDGANELDIVMNISAFKSDKSWVKTELARCALLIHNHNCLMKVIIETALLSDTEILRACKMCIEAGTDFVKTSTGFSKSGAVARQVRLIRSALPANIGVKASGGISDLKTARMMIASGADRLGVSAGVKLMKELAQEEIDNG